MEKREWWKWNLGHSPTNFLHFLLLLLLEKTSYIPRQEAAVLCEQLPCPVSHSCPALTTCCPSSVDCVEQLLVWILCVFPDKKSSFGMFWLLWSWPINVFSAMFSIFLLNCSSFQVVWRCPMSTCALWGVSRVHPTLVRCLVSGLGCISKSSSTVQELPPLNRKSSWSWPCSCWHSVGSRNQNGLTLSFFLRISNSLLPEQSLTSFCLTTLFDLEESDLTGFTLSLRDAEESKSVFWDLCQDTKRKMGG